MSFPELSEEDYLAKIGGMMAQNNHIEAGSNPKGIWPKDFMTMDERGSTELEHFIPKVESVAKTHGIKLLDVASGNGARSIPLGIHLANFGEVDLKLADMQTDAILLAQNLSLSVNLPTNLKLGFEVAKISDLSIETSSLDAITLVNGLHFIETEESIKSLRNLSNGLKPNGLMFGSVCSVYNASCIGQNDTERFGRVVRETAHGTIDQPYKSFHRRYGDMYFYTEASLKHMLGHGGFELVVQKSISNSGYPNGFGEKYKENIDFVAVKK